MHFVVINEDMMHIVLKTTQPHLTSWPPWFGCLLILIVQHMLSSIALLSRNQVCLMLQEWNYVSYLGCVGGGRQKNYQIRKIAIYYSVHIHTTH